MNASSSRDELVVQATRLRYARIPLLLALLFTLFLVLRVPFTQSRKSEAQVVLTDTDSTTSDPVEVHASVSPATPDEADAGADDSLPGNSTPAPGIDEVESAPKVFVPEVDDGADTVQFVTDATAHEGNALADTFDVADRRIQAIQSISPAASPEHNDTAAGHETPLPEISTQEDVVEIAVPDASTQPSRDLIASETDANEPSVASAFSEPMPDNDQTDIVEERQRREAISDTQQHAGADVDSQTQPSDNVQRNAESTDVEGDVPPRKPTDSNTANNLTLHNPHRNGAEIHYVVNGEVYSMHPGQTHDIAGGPMWLIEFHRGGSFGDVDVSLSAGVYAFQVTDKGWTLSKNADAQTIGQPPSQLPQSNR